MHEAQGQAEEAFALQQIFDMELHKQHTDVVGLAVFYAVMASALPGNSVNIKPDEALQISNHIIDRLQEHPADDPNRSSIRRFLEEYGGNRMEELQKILTNFISVADGLALDNVPFIGPTRHIAASVLFTCKNIVVGAFCIEFLGNLHTCYKE